MTEGKKNTLADDDIITERVDTDDSRVMGRRSTMGAIGAGVAAAAGILALDPSEAEAQCTDSDGGQWADPGGRGRRCRRPPPRGCSDSDGGRWSDPAGRGRRCGRVRVRPRAGCTDNDSGRWADPGGRGRRCGRGRPRSCTDRDGGRYADAAGRGRRC